MFTSKGVARLMYAARPLLIRRLASVPRSKPKSAAAQASPPTPAPVPKPVPSTAASTFGLDEDDLELYVKGLYKEGNKPKPKPGKTAVDAAASEKDLSGIAIASLAPDEKPTATMPQQPMQEYSPTDAAKVKAPEAEDKYSSWFTSSGSSASLAASGEGEEAETQLEGGVEKVRFTGFGSMRLDNDNPACDDEFDNELEEYPDYRLPQQPRSFREMELREMEDEEFDRPQQQQVLPEWLRLEQERAAAEEAAAISGTNKFKMPPIVVKAQGDEKTASEAKGKVGKAAAKTKPSEPEEPSLKTGIDRIPNVYHLPKYNNLTHQDMWVLLSKQIIFDNDFLLAINKPPGIPIHSPSTDCRHTLIEFLPELAQITKCEKVYPLHRLDKETTGVLLLAKTEAAATVIKKKFANCEMGKKYLGITKGCPELEEGSINIPISEGEVHSSKAVFRAALRPDLTKYNLSTPPKGARRAVTHFKVLTSRDHCALLEITPETGVKHQIRVHLGFGLGCPIIGDHKYSHRDKMAPQRLSPALLHKLKVEQSKVRLLPLHLHCSNFKFTMPEGFSTTNVFVHARAPLYFLRTLRALGLK